MPSRHQSGWTLVLTGNEDTAVTDLDVATLARLERYYDHVPRANAKVEDIGPFTLFVSTGAWPYYARPRQGHAGTSTATDVMAVRVRQEELDVPVSFEWIDEVSPGLAGAATDAGLVVEKRPLLVLDSLVRCDPPQGRVDPVPGARRPGVRGGARRSRPWFRYAWRRGGSGGSSAAGRSRGQHAPGSARLHPRADSAGSHPVGNRRGHQRVGGRR